MAETTSELRAGSRLLFAATLGTGLGLPPLPFYSIGIFAPILAEEFGWSFASILSGLALTTGILFFGAPVAGYLVDRYGGRRIAAASLAGLGLCYMTLALSTGSIVQYYSSWVAIALAGIGATPISFTRAIGAAFVRQRGLALGITLAGVGLFALTVKPLGNWLIETAGWRMALVAIGALPLFIGAPIVLWGFPGRTGSSAPGAETVRGESAISGLSVREALRTRAFWILIVASIPMAFASGAPFPNMENILRSAHFSPDRIVALTSIIGITIIAGRLVGGWLMDRIWAPLLGALALAAAAFGCWLLSQQAVSDPEAMLAIVLLGLTAGVEVDLLSFLVARYFGLRNYGVVYGIFFGVFAVCAGVGPGALGYAYDRAGSYAGVLVVCSMLFLFAACLLPTLGRYPEQQLMHGNEGESCWKKPLRREA